MKVRSVLGVIKDFFYFTRRYKKIEDQFLELTDFIELTDDFNDACYQVGGSKMMDFCLTIGTEVETIFRILLKSRQSDSNFKIKATKQQMNITIFRQVLEPIYKFGEYELTVDLTDQYIKPFENFAERAPEWFQIYSRYKHDKLELITKWNMKHSLFALGGLAILVVNMWDEEFFFTEKWFSFNVFNDDGLGPRFSEGRIDTEELAREIYQKLKAQKKIDKFFPKK